MWWASFAAGTMTGYYLCYSGAIASEMMLGIVSVGVGWLLGDIARVVWRKHSKERTSDGWVHEGAGIYTREVRVPREREWCVTIKEGE